MTYIAFVPGLEGHLSLAARTDTAPQGSYARVVEDVAKEEGLSFVRVDFQTSASPFPTLSDMGVDVARQIVALNDEHGAPGLIVASSVGAGVMLQALTEIKSPNKFPALLLFKPALDPLAMIETRMNATPEGAAALRQLKAEDIQTLGIPVDPSPQSPNPGKFMLTPAHVNDAHAIRILMDRSSHSRLRSAFETQLLPNLRIVTAQQDPLCPADNVKLLLNVLNNCVSVPPHGFQFNTVLSGRRSDPHTFELGEITRTMAHNLR